MGCNQSADDVDVSIIPGAPTISPVKASPVAEINKVVPVDDGLTKPILDAKAELQSTLDADEAKSKVGDAFLSAPFSLPEGWRVVCRLSRNDARARWGSRPRPAANSPATARGAAGASVAFEADLIAPELKQPLRLPLMLLPQWVDPKVGAQFMGRYEVRSIIPEKAGLERYGVRRGQRLEVFDQQDKTDCAIQVCDLERGSDVKAFAERLQLESLDSENKLFLRLRNMAIALPGRLAVVEDMPKKTLWQELSRIEPAGLAAKLACIANSVLEGLCRLHAHGWAHCGISPDTICLALDGCWKLNSLEFARKVRDLVPPVRVSTGTAVPPEVLLRLPVTEKVDVWQLAATLCEALMQKRIREEGAMAGVSQDGGNGVAENLCRLVDFLGPLPNNLVAQHPDREALFTPEGHVLRPASPDAAGQDLEAIEPTTSAEKSADSDPIPRPRLVVEALKDVEGGGDILEFLGRLLNPDPEQRPSAQEAKAHHFLRFAHTKQGGKGSAAQDPDRHAKIQDSHGDNAGHITRKGTGFVHVGELPPSDDEDEDEEEEAPKGGDHHVKIKDSHGDNAGHITRKGTGFVHMNELPPSDDEDEEEDEKPHHVSIKDSHGDNENKISRKGTGFVHIGELPPSDDEDEEEDAPAPAGDHHVKIQDSHGDCENKITRKGTGFVHIGELPPSDEEDEEEEEEDEISNEEQGVSPGLELDAVARSMKLRVVHLEREAATLNFTVLTRQCHFEAVAIPGGEAGAVAAIRAKCNLNACQGTNGDVETRGEAHVKGLDPAVNYRLAIEIRSLDSSKSVPTFCSAEVMVPQRAWPKRWSPREAQLWCQAIQVPDLAQKVKEYGVDGTTLLSFTEEDLRGVGISVPFVLRRVLSALKGLGGG
mmetsp:Transcript_141768/g.250498  ORF Transcript_141768/g.250498 Transcript_141768/m.250498 type:complete len:880 (-) Transcript_141768:158-2797(-)